MFCLGRCLNIKGLLFGHTPVKFLICVRSVHATRNWWTKDWEFTSWFCVGGHQRVACQNLCIVLMLIVVNLLPEGAHGGFSEICLWGWHNFYWPLGVSWSSREAQKLNSIDKITLNLVYSTVGCLKCKCWNERNKTLLHQNKFCAQTTRANRSINRSTTISGCLLLVLGIITN